MRPCNTRTLYICVAGLVTSVATWAGAEGGETIENEKLRVTVDPARKHIRVLDKIGGHHWQQPQTGRSSAWTIPW